VYTERVSLAVGDKFILNLRTQDGLQNLSNFFAIPDDGHLNRYMVDR
jgi:hypothetical protein